MEIVLIFPHHLFENHPAFSKDRLICFIEHPLFFTNKKYFSCFHKQKIVFHRATMKSFENRLKKEGYQTAYIENATEDEENSSLQMALKGWAPTKIHVAEFDDYLLEQEIKQLAKELNISLCVHASPGFLDSHPTFSELFSDQSHFSFHTFYIAQRKRLDILLDKKLKPLGGKWSLDAENRKKIPRSLVLPKILSFEKSKELVAAVNHVETNYTHYFGSLENFPYPITHGEANRAFRDFLENRLPLFGDYEDAILQNERVLFHSVLSPLLNTGLLTPNQVINDTLEYVKSNPVSLNSLEGFLRQIIGWREFVREVYHAAGSRQRTHNFFNHTRKIPHSFYTGTTGILPLDQSIKKLKATAYLHHIERLMILGNFFLLCEIHPTDVYKWFMELFIDAYDWVMVPNIYGMSQYADGGLMTTKPYFSSSNYILKMSDYPKGDWTEIWDGLFWRFMNKNISFFEEHPRLKLLCNNAKKKKGDTRLMIKAEKFLESLE